MWFLFFYGASLSSFFMLASSWCRGRVNRSLVVLQFDPTSTGNANYWNDDDLNILILSESVEWLLSIVFHQTFQLFVNRMSKFASVCFRTEKERQNRVWRVTTCDFSKSIFSSGFLVKWNSGCCLSSQSKILELTDGIKARALWCSPQ